MTPASLGTKVWKLGGEVWPNASTVFPCIFMNMGLMEISDEWQGSWAFWVLGDVLVEVEEIVADH